MAAGFVDYLRMAIGWWSAPPVQQSFVCAHVGDVSLITAASGINSPAVKSSPGSLGGDVAIITAISGDKAC